jgi:hypothetical protein
MLCGTLRFISEHLRENKNYYLVTPLQKTAFRLTYPSS